MRRVLSFGPALVVLLATLAIMLGVPAAIRGAGQAASQARVVLARHALDDDDVLEKLNRAVRNIATSVEPSVVHIEVFATRSDSEEGMRGFQHGSTGSGWVFDGDGHVITNAHVVRGATTINLQCYDGRLVRAAVVGMDALTDIAVLKASDASGLVPARRASDSRPQQGERVYAFGSPFGFKFSMSEGIVSGLGRSARSAVDFGGYSNFIQTDAAVNPGNSGGPLVDIKGRVIGMNVAIANAPSESRAPGSGAQGEGQSAGISFAIPLATIESVVPQLITKGTVSRGFLGVVFNTQGPERIIKDGSFMGMGVRLSDVSEGGAAHEAGLRPADVLVSINGQKTEDPEVMRAEISALRPGERAVLRVWSNDDFKDVSVTLRERPRTAIVDDARKSLPLQMGFEFSRRRSGELTVRRVYEGGPGDRAGLKPGQRIVSVGDTPVSTEDEFFGALVDQRIRDGNAVDLVVQEESDGVGTQKTLKLSLDE